MAAIFLFDGDCGFCTMSARFLERRIPHQARIMPWQHADLPALGLTRAQGMDAVWWCEQGREPLGGPEGIAALLGTSNMFWRFAGRGLRLLTWLGVAWPAYRLVARHRHRLPGGTAACAIRPPAGA